MSLDLSIVMAFLIANLSFGLLSGRGIKNIKEYALGGRNFSTATIVATIAATWIGGSNFSITIAETHKQGIFFLVCSIFFICFSCKTSAADEPHYILVSLVSPRSKNKVKSIFI